MADLGKWQIVKTTTPLSGDGTKRVIGHDCEGVGYLYPVSSMYILIKKRKDYSCSKCGEKPPDEIVDAALLCRAEIPWDD